MTSVGRTLQAVRPHIPLIKFPSRVNGVNAGVAWNMAQSSPQPSSPSMLSNSSRSPVSSSGLETVPSKYRRKPISIEEMEYIERGGPE
ncbi:alpha-ketoglutarate dehydrogenase component 4-like [Mercenaria mercenaria]|uniref:alpha-ketoglutarate dehydrogenase component 4-like n=1 Tax=Mercenaria mercenaria TaxID=6596 RepID=UPI00234E960A|nr:alpha-ketoglutarate dehydrogenase component 4-like [Mercenaria mercenaria]